MATFKASTEFRVVPEQWDNIDDKSIIRMFKAFKDWVLMNEEYMTSSMSSKAWKMYNKWNKYLMDRNLI
ncbi:MAG: hypothetical protein IJH55_09345 [Romboutsia sp.]|nr:hypothetical protein [Romboutsia sp.]